MNKIKRIIYGAIIGDCVGAFNEFRFGTVGKNRLRKIDEQFLRFNRDVFNHSYGHWTDDTTCSLITMHSDTVNGFYDPLWIIKRLGNWFDYGHYSSTDVCFDIGTSTAGAIMGNLNLDENTGNGNGALMRMYPVAISTYGKPEAERNVTIRNVAKITHPVSTSTEYCIIYVDIIHSILDGMTKDQLATKYKWIVEQPMPEPSGYVVDSLVYAFKTLIESNDYMSGLYKITNAGNDSDTVGSIYGSMAAPLFGLNAPLWMLEHLAKRSLLDDIIDPFVAKYSNKR